MHRIAFFVDGAFVAWADGFRGPKGSAIWRVAMGWHVLRALADDVNRIGESDAGNNAPETTVEIKP